MNFPEMVHLFITSIGPLYENLKNELKEIFIGAMHMIECFPGFNERKLLPGLGLYTYLDFSEPGNF